jgi:hypothetical protein
MSSSCHHGERRLEQWLTQPPGFGPKGCVFIPSALKLSTETHSHVPIRRWSTCTSASLDVMPMPSADATIASIANRHFIARSLILRPDFACVGTNAFEKILLNT